MLYFVLLFNSLLLVVVATHNARSLNSVSSNENEAPMRGLSILADKADEDLCKGLFWFHAPKTGSTLFLALQHICFPQLFEKLVSGISMADIERNEQLPLPLTERPFRYGSEHGSIYFVRGNESFRTLAKKRINIDHNPLRFDPLTSSKVKLTIGVFRDPKSRIVSSFMDGMHHEGMHEPSFQAMRKKWDAMMQQQQQKLKHNEEKEKNGDGQKQQRQHAAAAEVDSLKWKVRMTVLYANHPSMIGCYVKMLNGYMCSSPSLFVFQDTPMDCHEDTNCNIAQYNHSTPLNQTAIDIALKRLQQFGFIGLFEQFNTSIHMLHAVVGHKKTIPSVVELYPQRTTNHTLTSMIRKEIDETQYFDPYDTIIYKEAKRLFEIQKQKYNMR